MRGLIVSLLSVVLLVGCAGVSRVPLDKALTARQVVMTTVSDPHAWAPTTQRSWLELCDVTAKPAFDDKYSFEWVHTFQNCVPSGEVQFTSATGYVAGLVGPVLYSGAALGSAALIGPLGLAKSGPTVNQSGGGASQSQQQGQAQQQGQFQVGPKHGQ
jgi:hypothetical protein